MAETTKKDIVITNKPTPDKLKEIFLASQSYAAPYLNAMTHWENLIVANPLNNEPEGASANKTKTRSTVTIKHIRKLLEWRYPVIEQAFLSRKDLFNPSGREDIDSEVAKYHKIILNYQMNNEIDKTTFITRMVRAFLNRGTVAVHLGWKAQKGYPTKIVPLFKYEYVAAESNEAKELEMIYADVLARLAAKPQAESSIASHLVEGARYYEKHGIVNRVTVTDFTEVTATEEEFICNQPTLSVVSMHDVFGSPECKTCLQDSPYVIYRYLASIHELEENPDLDTSKVAWNIVSTLASGTDSVLNTIYGDDDKRRTVEVYEYWGLHDIDGKGTLIPVRISWVDGHVLECVPNPYPDKKHPFYSAAYSPDVTLESIYGSSDAYLVEENQAILSAMHRGIIDIHANSAYGQRGVAKNVLDFVNKNKFLKGENFEYDPNMVDPSAMFHTFDFPSIQPTTMAYMQQINADSDALTGIKSFNEGISGNALGDTAAGVSGVLSATALRESSIIGRLEAMLIQIAKRIMLLNTLYLDTKKIIALTGLEGLLIKSAHNPLIDVELDITNQAEDSLKAQEISFMLQTLGNALPPELTKRALMEIAELRNLPNFYNTLSAYDMSPPPPSPEELEIQRLQIELLKQQVTNEQAKGRELLSKANLTDVKVASEQATAKKTEAEADQIVLATERLASGEETNDKIRVISAQGEANTAANLVKASATRGYQQTPKG